MEEHRSREATLRGKKHQCHRRWGAEWCGAWGNGRGDPRGALARRAPRLEPPSQSRLQQARAAGSPGAEHCPAPRRAGGGVATASQPGRPGQRRATAKRRAQALATVSCCVVQRCCRSCRSVKRGTRSSEAPRADAKARSTNQGTGRGGGSYGKDSRVDERKIVERRRVEDSREGRAVPSHQAASSKKELFPRVKGVRKAVEVVELSQDAVDELDAKDSAPTRKLHEG
eukprot:4828981-Pleurochrysis_carterae.AAC.2